MGHLPGNAGILKLHRPWTSSPIVTSMPGNEAQKKSVEPAWGDQLAFGISGGAIWM